MERIYSISQFKWLHETNPGQRVIPPSEDDLVPLLDAEGKPALNEDGEPLMQFSPTWQPQTEDVELDTIVIVEPSNTDVNVVKLSFDKLSLGRFLARYVEFLDADGRNLLREELNKTADIYVPNVTSGDGKKGLRLV